MSKANVEAVKDLEKLVGRMHDDQFVPFVSVEVLRHLFAQLAEARALAERWQGIAGLAHETVWQLVAERDRLKASLAVVTGELEAMNANHRVMAGELAEMGNKLESELAKVNELGEYVELSATLQEECNSLKAHLAALSTPAPCGVEGHTMATYHYFSQGALSLAPLGPGFAPACGTGYCELCAALIDF